MRELFNVTLTHDTLILVAPRHTSEMYPNFPPCLFNPAETVELEPNLLLSCVSQIFQTVNFCYNTTLPLQLLLKMHVAQLRLIDV